MTIASNLAAQPVVSAPQSSASEAREVRGAPDRDGDSDDKASLGSHQGTRVDVSA